MSGEPTRWAHSVARIAPLAWPVLIGQVAVMAFATADTLLLAHHSMADLAALAVGSAAYITIFISLMGMVLALSPIAGQLFGARQYAQAGAQLHQAIWLALGLAAFGSLALLFPQPFLALAGASPALAEKVRGYLGLLALSLPASLLFTCFRGFNTAVSRPKAVMSLQLLGLSLKVPLSWLFISGSPALGLPAMGVAGCGLSTLIAMWTQMLLGAWVLRRDPFYAPFALRGLRLRAPHGPSLRALLRLGLPMGLSILIEVTGFSMMALLIARQGEALVAGHQIAANLVSQLFMLPLALSNATGTLVAQRIGANDLDDARRLGWHGLRLALALSLAVAAAVYWGRESIVALYTRDATIAAAALPLMLWVALSHLGDAGQTLASFVLRAWRVATGPLIIYALALWGVGLGGGHLLATNTGAGVPPWLHGARGYWVAAALGLALAALGLGLMLRWVLAQQRASAAAPKPRAG